MPEPLVGLSTDEILKRAIGSARSVYIRKGTKEARWAAVKNCLNLTEHQARRLVEWSGLDPDELVNRQVGYQALLEDKYPMPHAPAARTPAQR